MRLESKQWVPSRWSQERRAKVLRRVYACAIIDLVEMLGPHNGMIAAAELKAAMESELSRAQLLLRGIKTLGDTEQSAT